MTLENIEPTQSAPFQFATTTNIDFDNQRIHRVVGGANQGFDDLDLAFIELLGSWKSPEKSSDKLSDKQAQASAVLENESKKQITTSIYASDAKSASESASVESSHISPLDDPRRVVQEELAILIQDMTKEDVAFMKEAVIPGLPIISGSVPMNSLFPSDPQGGLTFKGYDISAKLAKLIEDGHKTGRAFRVEVDENSSVVLKIRNGKVSADFISNDRAAAFFIKQELDELKQRLQAKSLPVEHLGYRESSDSDGERRHFDDEQEE